MQTYFQKLFEHEHWANVQVTEAFLKATNPPIRAYEILSHMVAAQQTWISRINGVLPAVKVWETFDRDLLISLFHINFHAIEQILANNDLERAVSYQNSRGETFTNTVNEILTQLLLHASYHRGQIVLLLKGHLEILPTTDYIFYIR
ncbi:DinB family protein [Emticicia sp. 17c]|uniref:DinB family protein n=1 Tax=Emticicia sp. 17c TaxID=3127704 RepID=UPI00301BE340